MTSFKRAELALKRKIPDRVPVFELVIAPGGGYIISSANSIHSHVKPENYLAMLQSAGKYGTYEL